MHGFLRQARRGGLLAALALTTGASPLAGADPDGLAKLEPGRWVLKGPDGPERSLCLADAMQLVRLEHPAANCTVDAAAKDGAGGTIQYSCPGHGYGHTSVRVETPRVATVETQGLVDGRPFSYRATARKVGAC